MTAGGQLVDVSFVSLNAVGQALLSPGNFWNPLNWTPVVDAPEIPRANATLGDVYCRSGFREEDDHLPHCGQLYTKTPLGRLSNVTACQGDSGGPVLRQSDHIALGITHGIPNVPGATSCPTSDMSYVAFTFLSDDLAEIGGSIDGK